MTKSPTIRKKAPKSLDIKSLHAEIDGIDDYDIKIHKAARWYAKNGFFIVPFMHYGYPKSLSQRNATISLDIVDKWWHPTEGDYPGAAIAMAHGGKSGFCAIDLDKKGDIDGMQNLVDLQMAYGDYGDGEGAGLQTLMAITPSGGRHLVFRYHPEIISNADVSYPGIDTRGGLKKNPAENGGITFVEPSRKPVKGKKSTATYRWDENVTEIIDVPQWLVDVLNGRKPKTGKIQLQDAYVQSAPGEHGDGRDRNIYMDLMRFAGIGYTEQQLWDLMPEILDRMDPPDEDMVRRKIESVIQSDAFRKAQDEQVTKKQTATLPLVRNNKDQILKSVENLETILNWAVFEHEYGFIEYDQFSQKFICDKEPLESVSNWAVGPQLWISKKLKIDWPITTIRDLIEHIAYAERPHANIAREYMLSCPKPSKPGEDDFWGSGRRGPGEAFKRLCTEVLDLGNKNLHPEYNQETKKAYAAFLWFWLQGVAARACVPGCKMEIMLNIFGDQGIGKSLFFRELCPNPDWFTDSIQDSIVEGGKDNKDELMKLQATMIVEMPELNPIKRGGKSADDKMKQFISAQKDKYRRPFGHDSIYHPRTCALCGSSNNKDVYRDPSGARRFTSIDHGNVPIRVGDQDNGVLREIRDELWGEIIASFNEGELDLPSDRLLVAIPPKLRENQQTVNAGHKYEEIGIIEIIEWMSDKTRITWSEVIAYSKSVPGLRDAKESMVMSMVRKELNQKQEWKLKSGITLTNSEGRQERASRAWVNLGLDIEKNHKPGEPVPPHWTEYTGNKLKLVKEEY